MSGKTRKMTLSALFIALTVISLYIASVWPTGQLGLAAAASLFVAAAVIEVGLGSGLSVFIVSSALGMLILPNRAAPLLFIIFFGYYPIVKSLIEHVKCNKLQWLVQWLLKQIVFNLALIFMWFFMRELAVAVIGGLPEINIFRSGIAEIFILAVVGNVAFVIFDIGFTKLIWVYINRVSKYMRKGNNK